MTMTRDSPITCSSSELQSSGQVKISEANEPLLSGGSRTKMLSFDDALVEIGEFGRFQIINYLLLCLPLFFSAGNSLTYVFTAGVPNYRCFVEGCDDEINPDYGASWVSNAVPGVDQKVPFVPEQCKQYVPLKNLTEGECIGDNFGSTIQQCKRWVYENNERTIVGEWNITCVENQWKLSMVGTVHFLGILFGTVLFGYLADRFGRKIIFVFCIVLMSVTGVAQAVCSDYITFQFFVFVNALGTSGVYPLAFILGVELVGRKKREMSGVVLNYFYALGEASIGLIAWLSKDWVTIQLAVSVPPAMFILYYWFVPESVRWLLAQEQTEKAGKIMKHAAKMNGVKLSKDLLNVIEKGNCERRSEEPSVWITCKQLLRSRTLCIRSLILFYCWAANAFVYYGLSVNSTTLGGNKYLNFALVCLIEIPGYTICWILMNKLGRRWSFTGSLLFCSFTCIAAAFVPDGNYPQLREDKNNWPPLNVCQIFEIIDTFSTDINWAVVTLFLLGKLGITSSFAIAYVYTAELYPTIMRSVGVGACSTVGRLGALVAPFAPLLGIYSKPLPLLLFSGVSLLAGGAAFILPETLGSKLPDTIAEAEHFKLVPTVSPSSSERESDKDSDRET